MISAELQKNIKKVGQPPGTPLYTGSKKQVATHLYVMSYTTDDFYECEGTDVEKCLSHTLPAGITWINVQGLQNMEVIGQLAKKYDIHPLTIEDILNVQQRPKVDEFSHYKFIILKTLSWKAKRQQFSTDQLSIILGKEFVLTFQETANPIFDGIIQRLKSDTNQRLRQQGSDYLAYRLMDTIVDYYFIVLEALGNKIDNIEEKIISHPVPQHTKTLYRLKRQMLSLRKSIWPMREVINHLLQVEEKLISSFTRIYLRDLYDHVVQAIDTVETFRDILSNLLDVYLSSLTNKMNEVMKTLTIIATIFIPLTFIASIYGMNFIHMPELHWRNGYYMVLSSMLIIAIGMLIYFRKKQWI